MQFYWQKKNNPPHSSPQRITRFTAFLCFIKQYQAKTFLYLFYGCRGNESCIFFAIQADIFYQISLISDIFNI